MQRIFYVQASRIAVLLGSVGTNFHVTHSPPDDYR